MSIRITGSLATVLTVGVLALGAMAGCTSSSKDALPAPGLPTPTAGPTGSPEPGGPPNPPGEGSATGTATRSPAPPAWPSPENCISYNPANVTVNYEAGIHSVNDGNKVIMRLAGGPGDEVGQKGLALAQRYRKHCFLGRDNTREENNAYIFDYWRDPSGQKPTIPGQEDDCSGYDRTNLTVEDMGGGDGWRVKDHDHILHLFDNESDARNGKLVLAKYRTICYIGDAGDDNPNVVSYSL